VERRNSVHDQELLGVVDTVRVCQHLLLGKPCKVFTDNWAHKLINSQSTLDVKRQSRFILALQGYDFTIELVPGSVNPVADALSQRSDHTQLGTMLTIIYSLRK
jgi:hypothetical protein